LRHGQPQGGEVLRGRVDHPLSEQGWQQMWRSVNLQPESQSAMADSLAWDEIITSPLQRCRSFAEKLSDLTNLPVSVNADWQEIDYGDWDGMSLSDWRHAAAEQFREFRRDLSALKPPNGESFIQFRDRILGAWQQVLDRPQGSRVLLVTHGGVMRVVLPTVLGMPLNQTGVLEIPFACLSRVQVQGQGDGQQTRLLAHNVGDGKS
jgi:alpha-ribazole phosphatase